MKQQIKLNIKPTPYLELGHQITGKTSANVARNKPSNRLYFSVLSFSDKISLNLSFPKPMHNTIAIFLLFLSFHLPGQVTIGSWESHNPMSSFQWIGETEQNIYAANRYGVLSYNRETQSSEALTKVNYLTGNEISFFKCAQDRSVCVVGYADGDLDLIDDGGTITNQPAIKNSQAIGDKRINDIFFSGSFAWIASGIGVIKLNLSTYNIQEYTEVKYAGVTQEIMRLHHAPDALSLVTNETILQTDPATIFIDPTYTELAPPAEIAVDRIKQLFQLDNQLFLLYQTPSFLEDTLYQYTDPTWSAIEPLSGRGIRHIHVSGDTLLVTHSTSITQYNSSFESISTEIFTYGPTGLNPSQAEFSAFSSKIIAADLLYGGVEVAPSNQFNATVFGISSPFPENSILTNLGQIGDDIFAMPGGNEYTYNRPDIHRFQGNEWVSLELRNSTFPSFVNGNNIVEVDETLYVASDRGGIAILDQDLNLKNVLNDANSPISDLQEGYDYFGIAGIDADDEGNVYISHTKDKNPLKILTSTGDWVEISLGQFGLEAPKTAGLLYTNSGFIMQIIIDVGILVYNTNGTPANLTDDQATILTSSPSEGALPSSQVTCITEDLDGEVWIGTNAGIGIIYTPENIFNPGFEGAQQIIVNQDGFNGYLFGTETIEAIAVDGANRKWIGTFSSGLFLISADGQNQLHAFNIDNSPLLNNKITDLAIRPSTGEVFIASESGLISYRGDATQAVESMENISIFPNPVKPEYKGSIAINNLTSNAVVRITDVAGNLVYETVSNGGQAIWQGSNLNGARVSAGVYLVHVSTETATNGVTKKILFLSP